MMDPRNSPAGAEGPLELLVIGAGPHALSLLTRLIDDEPDLLTEEQRSYVIQRATRYRSHEEVRGHLRKRFDGVSFDGGGGERQLTVQRGRTLVVDSLGRWMAQWERDFDAFGIDYLRSHMHLHTDPFDFQALSVWAHMQKRGDELRQMEHVDRDQCRKAGYYGPFVNPSNKLFLDFCDNMVQRYGLSDLVTKGTVEDVRIIRESNAEDSEDHDDLASDRCSSPSTASTSASTAPSSCKLPGSATPRLFEAVLADGRRFSAKRVVCAMGPGPAFQSMRATLPWWAEELQAELAAAEQKTVGAHAPTLCLQHSSTLSSPDPDLLRNRRVLVVGGGQTSAHLAQLALKGGAATVTLSSRKRIARKPYDVDVAYMGDNRPKFLQKFWQLDDFRKRKAFNANLRRGGSMTHDTYAELLAVSAASKSAENKKKLVEGASATARTSKRKGCNAKLRSGGGATSHSAENEKLVEGSGSPSHDANAKLMAASTPSYSTEDNGLVEGAPAELVSATAAGSSAEDEQLVERTSAELLATSAASDSAKDEQLAEASDSAKDQQLAEGTSAELMAASAAGDSAKGEQLVEGASAELLVASAAGESAKDEQLVEGASAELLVASAAGDAAKDEQLVEGASAELLVASAAGDSAKDEQLVEGASAKNEQLAERTSAELLVASAAGDAAKDEQLVEGASAELLVASLASESAKDEKLVTGTSATAHNSTPSASDSCTAAPGTLELLEETDVVQAHWCAPTNEVHVRFEDGRLAHFDFVWLATGGNFDMELVPLFASLQKQHPIPNIDGLPQLQPDLSWAKKLPDLYVMGAFAQLQLGADALNLAGARSGGVVVARALLKDPGVVGGEEASSRVAKGRKGKKKKVLKETKVSPPGYSAKKGEHSEAIQVTDTGEWKECECDCGC